MSLPKDNKDSIPEPVKGLEGIVAADTNLSSVNGEKGILRFERISITLLQAPMQDRTKAGRPRTDSFRLWPRYREKTDNEKEIRMNFARKIDEDIDTTTVVQSSSVQD